VQGVLGGTSNQLSSTIMRASGVGEWKVRKGSVMDKKGVLKHKEVFDKWLAGKVVEVYGFAEDEWKVNDAPNWCEISQYRIQPEAGKHISDWRIRLGDEGDSFVMAQVDDSIYMLINTTSFNRFDHTHYNLRKCTTWDITASELLEEVLNARDWINPNLVKVVSVEVETDAE
jgi:hypothetical protein